MIGCGAEALQPNDLKEKANALPVRPADRIG
jgi:hypothetical protein